MITLSGITKKYDRRRKKMALKGISLSFPDKGFFILTGPSGSGKTTLLNIIGGMDAPTDGEFRFDGRLINSKNYDEYRSQNVAFVFQFFNLIDEYSIYDNLKIAFSLHGVKADKEKVVEALKLVSLPDGEDVDLFLKRKPKELSGGQMQRLAIARALIKSPKILILDEPTSAVDKANGKKLISILKEISKTKLVIVTTHDKALFSGSTDGEVTIEKGRLVSSTVPASIDEKEAVVGERIKAKLPLWEKARFALKMFSGKKGSLIFSMMALTISFSVFAFSFACSSLDSDEAAMTTQVNRGSHFAFFEANNEDGSPLSGEQASALENLQHYRYDSFPLPIKRDEVESFVKTQSLAKRYFHTLNAVYLPADVKTSDLYLSPSFDFGKPEDMHLPSSEGEMAITDVLADFILAHREQLDIAGLQFVVNKADLINTVISFECPSISDEKITRRITGIYTTDDEEALNWSMHDLEVDPDLAGGGFTAMSLEALAAGNSIAKSFFFFEDNAESGFYGAMVKTPGNAYDYANLLKRLREGDKRDVTFANPYTGYSKAIEQMIPLMVSVSYALAISSAVLAFGLLLSYYFSIVKDSEKTFGILKAVGATPKTLLGLLTFQIIFVVLLTFAAGLGVSSLYCLAANSVLGVDCFSFEVVSILGVFGCALLVAFGLTVLSFLKLKKQTPVNIING